MKRHQDARSAFELDYWRTALAAANGQVCAAARLAGTNRTDTYKRLHRLRIRIGARCRRRNRELGLRYREARTEFERRYWQRALRACGGIVTRAAQLAGRNRTWTHRHLKELGLRSSRPYGGNWAFHGL